MYIVAGRLKGRRFSSFKSLKVVEARIKKVLYNLIRDKINQAKVLDLFAGSGSLGIEALSWGAKEVVFVDINKRNIDLVRKNLASLGLLGASQFYCKDAILACKKFWERKEKFDFIFLDPPYGRGLLTKSLKTIRVYDIVAPSGFIVSLGWHKEEPATDFSCIFNRRYGDRLIRFYQKQ